MPEERPKLALYWAAGCGGCEVAVLNLHEKLLDLLSEWDFFFCPCLFDTKRKDVEALGDGALAVTLFNGSIRTSENEEWARLLRRKSKVLVAFGACAYGGGIPGLSNLHDLDSHWRDIYLGNLTTENPARIMPGGSEGLPEFYRRVKSLSEVVEVDYSVPGCPPEPERVWEALSALSGANPPERGAIVGAGGSAVCDECTRSRSEKRIESFRRIWEFAPDREECLLEQGLVCLGVSTRSGCGALCPRVNMPCIGCYGPCEGVYDHAAKTLAALGSAVDISRLKGLGSGEAIAERVDAVLSTLPDVAGTVGKFHNAGGLFALRRKEG